MNSPQRTSFNYFSCFTFQKLCGKMQSFAQFALRDATEDFCLLNKEVPAKHQSGRKLLHGSLVEGRIKFKVYGL